MNFSTGSVMKYYDELSIFSELNFIISYSNVNSIQFVCSLKQL